jgi:hypothetical protein
MSTEETFILAYSIEDRRPACLLLQIPYGGSVPDGLFHALFPAETWIVAGPMVENLRPYRSTRAELEKVSSLTLAALAEAGGRYDR